MEPYPLRHVVAVFHTNGWHDEPMRGSQEALRWAAGLLGFNGDAAAQVLEPHADAFGLEVHHDGSGRVDLSVFREAGLGRTLEVTGHGVLTLGPMDTVEYDLVDGRARRAGVFHQVVGTGVGQPLLVAVMDGRDDRVRRVYPVADPQAFSRYEVPHHSRPFLTSPHALRVSLDGGPRLGLEVFINPRVFEVGDILSDLGVDRTAIAAMQAVADLVPVSRRVPRGPLLVPWHEGMAFTHFCVSWATRTAQPVLKSYLMVCCGPAPKQAQMRDAGVRAHGVDWPGQVRWAAAQLPLRSDPGADLGPWAAAVDPHGRGGFERRLSRDGLTPQSAQTALLPQGVNPDPWWWATYQELVAMRPAGEVPDAVWDLPFGPLLWTFASQAAAAEPAGMRMDLLRRLSQISAPVLTHMLQRDLPFGARMAAQMAPAQADHPRDRFAAFCARIGADGLSEVFSEYPVLGMQMAVVIEQFRSAAAEMLSRVQADRDALDERFGPLGPLTEVSVGDGDSHNGGRCVRVLRFGDIRIVYKPRSVHLEALYADVAQRVSRRWPMVAPAVLDRGDYGYVEFVTGHPCDDYAAFYRNAGGLLAVLHALAATDCHHENLIAAGDNLVLIDAETLLAGTASPASMPYAGDADPVSVLRVGMLPARLWLDGRRQALDITALGSDPGGTVRRVRGWRAVNTDAMHRGRVEVPVPHPGSLPSPAGEAAPLADHVEDLVTGFRQVYRVVLEGRDSWLTALLDGMSEASNRVVLRPTYVYASLLQELAEPEAMRSARDRAWVLEKLTRAYLDDEQQWPLVAAEQQALQRGDVPYFQTPLCGGGTRWLGGELPDVPGSDQLTQVRERLAELGEADLRLQVGLIRASVTAGDFRMSRPASAVPAAGSPKRAADVARACFERVSAAALGDGNWVGPALLPDGEHVTLRPMGLGFYDGRLGLAVAYAMAGEQVAMGPVLEVAADPDLVSRLWQAEGPGLAGIGGFLRGLDLLGHAGPPEESLRSVLTPRRVAAETRLDLLGGVAGLIGPLTRRDGFDEAIAAAAQVLVTAQEPQGGWRTLAGSAPLTGMAHGAAGIAMALAEAGVALDDETLIDAAVRGLDYEAAVYDPDHGNWPDFRESADGGFMLGWCAGAPGIALSRRRVLDLLPDHPRAPSWREDLERALAITAQAPALARDHLCCGNAGRIAILRALGRDARALEEVVLSRRGLPIPMLAIDPEVLPMPGLFTGLPGIGAVLGVGSADWVWQVLM